MTERARVLELVKNGRISIEQADQLLEALESARMEEASKTASVPVHNVPMPPMPPMPPKPPRAPRGGAEGKFTFEQMIELGKFGIRPEFVRQLAEQGLNNLSFRDIVELGKFGITPKYVTELRQLSDEFGMGELDVHKIIELGKFGVRPDYVRQMIESQMFDLTGEVRFDPSRITEQHERKRAKLEAKLAKAHAKLAVVTRERERERLEEIIEEITDELEALEVDERDSIEVELEAELEAEASGTSPFTQATTTTTTVTIEEQNPQKLRKKLSELETQLASDDPQPSREALEAMRDAILAQLEALEDGSDE